MTRNQIIYIIFAVLIVICAAAILFSPSGTPSPATTGAQNTVGNTLTATAPTPANPNPTNPNPAPESSVKTVSYTNSGFSPQTLIVSKGDTVLFTNNSTHPFHPASDPHPAHNGYPTKGGCVGSTFDACGSIAPGGSWSFKFDIAGTWGYHNHLNPSTKGTIVVR